VLLIVAVTLVRNGSAIRAMELGLETRDVISVRQHRRDRALVERAYKELTSDPRIGQVVVTSRNPLFGEPPGIPLLRSTGFVLASYNFVSPEYFSFLEIQIVHGRGFSAEEARQQSAVVIVSAAGAQQLWPGEDPMGKTLRLNIDPPGSRLTVADTMHERHKVGEESKNTVVATVIGVATDAVNGFVYQGTNDAHLYLPTSVGGSQAQALMVRGRTSALTVEQVRSILQRAHSDPMAFDVLTLDEMVAVQMFPLRAASLIGSLLSGIALALSISGLYGVLTYTFGQRTQEIGIRMALGASAAGVKRLVFDQSVRLAGWGTAIGLLIGFSVMKILGTVVRLDNVSVIDPGAFAVSVALIALAVAVAAYAPARRTSRIEPALMLRGES
jgi:hypothetical protein